MINREAEKRAYNLFISAGMTPEGACGLIGNLEAESDGFYTNRLEYLCHKRLKEHGKTYTDESYTAAVDAGKITYNEFLNPLPGKQYGYGLAQWTSPARKAGLWTKAKQRGCSIADETMQLEFLMDELKSSYKSVLEVLKRTKSIQDASDVVLKKFECPADTGATMCRARAERGKTFYSIIAKKEGEKVDAIDKVIKIAENELGYLEKASNSSLENKKANAGYGNYTKYWRDILPSFQGQPWCAAFVSWVMLQAFGKDTARKLLKHWPFTYCPTLGSLFVQHTTPQRGDIVLFYRGGVFAHTGIVTDTDNGYFTTIEGNASGTQGITPNGGGVVKKRYRTSDLPGTKFIRPDYSAAEGKAKEETQPESKKEKGYMFDVGNVEKGSTGNDVKLIQRLLKSYGYKGKDGAKLVIDGIAGDNTVFAIRAYQAKNNLSMDGCAGPKTWAKLLLRDA